MNYRHIFHAGNHADVVKHAALALTLEALKRKPAPFGVLETHAGVGVYDLLSDQATRSPEWQSGIGLVWDSDAPALSPLKSLVEAQNPDGALRFYPGSPEIARQLLRPGDRYIGCELHPQDAAALKARYSHDARLQIHARDGWEALGALLPLAERRGLVLVDPPYEQPGELARAARAIAEAHRRFGQATALWWRPMKSAAALDRADGEAMAQGVRGILRMDLWVAPPAESGPLTASSLAFVRPPFGLEEDLAALGAALAELLDVDGGGFEVRRLGTL